jgi:hypothetical protein
MRPQALRLTSRLAFLLTQVEDEEGRTHLLIRPAIEEENEHRWCLWRPDHAGIPGLFLMGCDFRADDRLRQTTFLGWSDDKRRKKWFGVNSKRLDAGVSCHGLTEKL